MKKRHFIILFIAGITVTILFFAVRKKEFSQYNAAEDKIGGKILKKVDFDQLASVRIVRNGKITEIAKFADGWKIADLYGYPVSPEKFIEFTNVLADMKNIQNIKAGKSQLKRLGLDPEDKDNTPATVELLGTDTRALAKFVVGNKHMKKANYADMPGMDMPDGRFIMIPESGGIFVADSPLSEIDQESVDWAEKQLFSATELKNASLTQDGKVLWKLLRDKKGADMKLENIPEGKELDTSKVSSVSSCLGYFSFAKIPDPATAPTESGLDKAKIFVAEDFEGIKYEVMIGGKTDSGYYVKIKAANCEINPDPTPEGETPEAKEKREKNNKEKVEESVKKAGELNKKLSPWIFIIQDYKADNMTVPLEGLFKKPEEKKDKNPKTEPSTNP